MLLGGDYNIIPQDEDAARPEAWREDALARPESRAAFRRILNLGFTEFAARCQAGESLAASGAAQQVDLAAICTAYDRCKSQFLSGHPGS